MIYTLLGSCRRHGLNPFDYLKDLFTRLPSAKITEIKQFTPASVGACRGLGFTRDTRTQSAQPDALGTASEKDSERAWETSASLVGPTASPPV